MACARSGSRGSAVLSTPTFSFPPPKLIHDNKALVGGNLGHLWEEEEMLLSWLERIFAWHAEGKVHPTVGARFPFAEAAAAHHDIQDRKNVGHRWIDERLERALAGPIEQVLSLGAGYDTRA